MEIGFSSEFSLYLISEIAIRWPARSLAAMELDEDTISYLVNNLTVIVKKDAKTILSIYYQQNNLEYSGYKVTLVQPEDQEWRMFKAGFKLNRRCVIGSGQSPKQAELAAA